MRDNLPNMLRSAAKEWREKNKVVATGATRYGAALEEAAEAIEELQRNVEDWKATAATEREAYWHWFDNYQRDVPCWIPVTERLPKEEEEIYWCYTNIGIMCECRWTNNRWGLGESDKWGWNVMDVPQYQKVTHWMPLPQPPKEEAT